MTEPDLLAGETDDAPAVDQGPELRLGVSSCLLGEEVRFDGGHKHDRWLTDGLGRYVRWFPLCPEVEIGLGTPRETIRLEGEIGEPRLVSTKTRTDLTDRMREWSDSQMATIASWDLHGFVLKRGSPSCGVFRVRVYNDKGMPVRDGRGLFASRLMQRFPLLPVEEEGRLHDPSLRESFIERLFIHERWKAFLRDNPTPGGLVDFHAVHKFSLLARGPDCYRRLGRLVADAGKRRFDELTAEYSALLAEGLERLSSRGRHANVLQHVMGFLKKAITADDKDELVATIEDYRRGLLPLIVPITLLKHHLRRCDVPDWILRQAYLDPYPKELMLRNRL